MTTTDRDLRARVEQLEQSSRRLVRWGGLLAATGAAAWLMAMAPVCKTVWAERFVLKDARGAERALLTAYENGGRPRFALLGPGGKAVAEISVDESGSAFLALFDGTGRRSVLSAVDGLGSDPAEKTGESAPDADSDGVAWLR